MARDLNRLGFARRLGRDIRDAAGAAGRRGFKKEARRIARRAWRAIARKGGDA